MGDIYYDNKFINQNFDQAIFWYGESSNLNNSKASFALARIYQFDKENIDESVKWYKISAQQGNKEALKELKKVAEVNATPELMNFLDKYQHQSAVQESELLNVNLYKNLEFYPKSEQEMYELGKSYLDLEDKQDPDIQNAAFWFRKAKKHGSIEAAKELMIMYKIGMLGNNLKFVANEIKLDILNMCYHELQKLSKCQEQDKSKLFKCLENVKLLLNSGNNNFPNANNLSKAVNVELKDIDRKGIIKISSELKLFLDEVHTNIDKYSSIAKELLKNKS